MKISRWLNVLALIGLIILAGCINTESKEYRYKLNADGTGEGTITFENIVSSDDDERDVSLKDFGSLVTDYLEGTSWEDEHSGYRVTGKRLYEKDDKLMGEITFTFAALDSVGFLTFPGCTCAPILFHLGSLDETYNESNGKVLGSEENPSFVSWDADAKEFSFRTTVLSDLSGTRSLLAQYKTWKGTQK